jgi:phage shock protein PspC (stress-responsive transcriptional regulator)
MNRKIIGYIGGISSWFDIDLLIYTADIYKDCLFVIIGPINNPEILDWIIQAG